MRRRIGSLRTPPHSSYPVVLFNAGAETYVPAAPNGTYALQPGQIDMHPGPAGQYSVSRWTASSTGSFTARVTFEGLSGVSGAPATTTDVHIQHNGVDVAMGGINIGASGNSFAASPSVQVTAGDTIDFAVGYGNGSYVFDSTGVDAVVCKD